MKKLELLPAVDVADGQAVRLVQGEAGSETGYGDPLEAARQWVDQGAEWIHLVDLDRAFGRGENLQVIERVIQGCPDVKIELSGGIRDDRSLQQAVDMGAQRVNIGTAALENPEWTNKIISDFGELVAIGLDVRGETLAARGWTEDGGNLFETLQLLEDAGCARYVVTDVNKDGNPKGSKPRSFEKRYGKD
jgi:Phosphoribosylformimino-5-aminoimidazole carboxamide ribonucleotide (ProFAR) isomerase